MYRFEEEIRRAIEGGVFPSAALLVGRGKEVVYRNSFGTAEETIYDIASLTKPLATTTLTLIARREGRLSLDTSIFHHLPEESDEEKKRISVRHLLKHTSGLPAWKPYYEEIGRQSPELLGKRACRTHYLGKILQESLEVPVAYQRIYSDLGFILLGILLEEIYRQPLDLLFREKIALPLELKETFFLPVDPPAPLPFPSNRFAPTGESPFRGRTLRAEVHDDNAYALGGVAGHAGLFSTADDLHRFLGTFSEGFRGRSDLLPQDQVHEFVGEKVKIKLGWDIPTPNGNQPSQAGRFFSNNTIGHLGYTGCSFWLDLEQDFHVILLTNRVHPTPQNERIKEIRPVLHDLVFQELIQKITV